MLLRNLGILLLFAICTWSNKIPVDTKIDFYLQVWEGIKEIVPEIYTSTDNVNCTQINDASRVYDILSCVKQMACILNNTQNLATPLRTTSSVICKPPQPVTDIPQTSLDYLRESLLTKPTLTIFIQSYTRQITAHPPSNNTLVQIAKTINDLPTSATINFTEYEQWNLRKIIADSNALNSTGHVLLSAFDTSFVKITALLNNTYISANMPARNAYAPVIRNDPDIKFLENNGDALATVISAILRRNLNDLVLIYDGETDLDFLTRQMKALYYTTFKLDAVWENNKERLKKVFKRKATGRSYVLLLNRTNLKETANQLLNYALIHQQMRMGVQWILFSLDFGCDDVFTDFKNTGATLYCFAQSNVFTPLEPVQDYSSGQTLAAQYIDALTYITTKSTMPNYYILRRLLFQEVQPYVNGVESIAIFDCSFSSTHAVGSWQPAREPSLILTADSTTLQGRTVNVGFIQYGPFYDVFFNKELGFSVALMQEVARQSGIQINPIIYPFDSSQPFGQRLQKEIEAGNIYFGAAPITLSASTSAVRGSDLLLPTDFYLLRRKPSPTADFLLILRPFTMPLWLASVLVGAIFAAILYVYAQVAPSMLKHLAEGEPDSKRSSFERACLAVTSAFSIAKSQIIPVHLSSRMLTLIMWMFAILLIVTYCCGMMTILLRVRSPTNRDSDPYQLIAGASARDLLLIKHGIGYDTLAASLQNNSNISGFTTVNSLEEAFANVIGDERKLLLASSIETSYIQTNSCALERIPYPAVSQVLLTFPISSTWEFGDKIDDYLVATSSSGVFQQAIEIYFQTGRCFIPNFKVAEPTVLDIAGAASLFLLLLIGLIVSFICLGIELTIRYFEEKKDKNPLIFGQTYNATVTSIKKSGVTVTIPGRPEKYFIPNNQLHPDPLKVYNALDIGLSVGSEIQLTFFGKSKTDGTTKFCRALPLADA